MQRGNYGGVWVHSCFINDCERSRDIVLRPPCQGQCLLTQGPDKLFGSKTVFSKGPDPICTFSCNRSQSPYRCVMSVMRLLQTFQRKLEIKKFETKTNTEVLRSILYLSTVLQRIDTRNTITTPLQLSNRIVATPHHLEAGFYQNRNKSRGLAGYACRSTRSHSNT